MKVSFTNQKQKGSNIFLSKKTDVTSPASSNFFHQREDSASTISSQSPLFKSKSINRLIKLRRNPTEHLPLIKLEK